MSVKECKDSFCTFNADKNSLWPRILPDDSSIKAKALDGPSATLSSYHKLHRYGKAVWLSPLAFRRCSSGVVDSGRHSDSAPSSYLTETQLSPAD